MGKEGYFPAERLMAKKNDLDMGVAISHLKGLTEEMDILSQGSLAEKILHFRRRRALSSAFDQTIEDIGRISFTRDLINCLDNLQYFKGTQKGIEITHIKGIVEGCQVDVIRERDEDIDEVRGKVGVVDVSKRPLLARCIFDNYTMLLEQRENIAHNLTR